MRSPWLLLLLLLAPVQAAERPLKALIIDGQNNHKWQETTPVLKKLLEETGLFAVDVATSPPKGSELSGFLPKFAGYAVVVSNYNGESWSPAAREAFEKYLRAGGGFVVYHAANNPFADWKEYNEMIGLGGWGDRTEAAGPYLRFRDGKMVREAKPGPSGHHGKRHPFQVTIRNPKHPITAGLPALWMHSQDELYDSLRGPTDAKINLLATAYSDPATGGTGEHEPMLMTLAYGQGRVFHTTLGHDLESLSCVGFIATFQRGSEWVATGKVTQKVPPDFPTAGRLSMRK
ncbi:MAG: ThuA domain-containing protein [Acidobacteria bacterium]|nr:ThuA domain-containing protein [Acidobacteriota bacterium]